MRLPLILISVLMTLGCDGSTPAPDSGPSGTDAGPPPPTLPTTLGPSDRPAELVVPGAYDGETALPVLVLLHGYSTDGQTQNTYLGMSRETRRRGFYLIIPDGLVDSSGNHYWNATPACCDRDGTGVDDSSYLMALVDELSAQAPVADVYFGGHSNGGFMSYRMACDHADRVSAIFSLAGNDFATEAECGASQPVSVLQIQGDLDLSVPIGGGAGGSYPAAADTVARWAGYAGCADSPTIGTPLDLDISVDGDETTVDRYVDGCSGAEAELWTIVGGDHVPAISRSFTPTVLAWLATQAR